MTKQIDARGLACPQPVILTRKALLDNNVVVTIVDSEISQLNVTRMAEKAGCQVQTESRADGVFLTIRRGEALPQTDSGSESTPATGGLVLTIPSEIMGRGDEELGRILLRGFLHALGEVSPLPQTIILFNSGVKLATEGSPGLEDLKSLRSRGVELLVCGTCLGHFGLKEKLAVGEISNMYTIAELLLRAGKVLTL
jgi:selenium metabolism protein YedF